MENNQLYTDEQLKRRSKKMLLYIGIFSIVMLFAGLTSAYLVTQADGIWLRIRLPEQFYYSTAIIVFSSITMFLALKMARASNFRMVKTLVFLTLVLGVGFTVSQVQGWKALFERGHTVRGENIFMIRGEYGTDYTFMYKGEELVQADGEFYRKDDRQREEPMRDRILGSRDVASSYLVGITFIHFLHLLGGLIYLVAVYFGAVRMKYSGTNTLSLELCSTYWHFLGALWIYLFLFLLFIH